VLVKRDSVPVELRPVKVSLFKSRMTDDWLYKIGGMKITWRDIRLDTIRPQKFPHGLPWE
jgi:hypothetical protein